MPDELLDQLKVLGDKRGVSAADVVRTACEKYLAAIKKAEELKRAAQ